MKRETAIEEIKNYLEENPETFADMIEELDAYNGYLGDDRLLPMEELDEMGMFASATDLLRKAFYGHDSNYYTDASGNRVYEQFNPNRDYFYYNGYGNFVSTDERDYSDKLDDYVIEEFGKYRDYIDIPADLEDLFDELEDAE